MKEKELISQLQQLRQIEPSKDWVISTKNQVLGESPKFTLFPYLKPAFAGLVSVFVLFGLFSFAQSSVPGDFLYTFKKITEKGQAVFVSEQEKPQTSLELANKRLEELTKIAEANQVKKLTPAISEFQASLSEAARSLSRMEATSSDPVANKKLVEEVKKLDKNKQLVEEALGVVFGGQEFDELQEVSEKLEVKLVIDYLETRTLNEEQAEILNRMKELVEEGKYSEALGLLGELNQ